MLAGVVSNAEADREPAERPEEVADDAEETEPRWSRVNSE